MDKFIADIFLFPADEKAGLKKRGGFWDVYLFNYGLASQFLDSVDGGTLSVEIEPQGNQAVVDISISNSTTSATTTTTTTTPTITA